MYAQKNRMCGLICFVLCLFSSWCTTCGVFPARKPGRSGKNKPRGQSRRSFCSEGLYSTSESSNNHTIQEPRGAPEVLALLPAPNSPKAATRLWSVCYQPGKTSLYTAVTTVLMPLKIEEWLLYFEQQ